MKILAVSISQKPEHLQYEVPFYCLSEKGPDFPPQTKSRERVEYLADKQNRAMETALRLYPETTHVLWIDSHYLTQTGPIEGLLRDYDIGKGPSPNWILGGPILCHNYTRIFPRTTYYDTWSTPEYHNKLDGIFPLNTFQNVSGVGGVYVYPRYTWEEYGYGVPDYPEFPRKFPDSGCQHNWLCQKSGLPVCLDWNVTFWRTVRYPLIKRFRCSLGAYLHKP
jgi:hypothetical protein